MKRSAPVARVRKTPAAALKRKATTLHSQYVRSRDAGCVRCRVNGAVPSSQLQCAHIVSRRYAAVRTYEWNACALCSACHRRLTEHPNEAVAWNTYWCANYSPHTYSELIRLADEGINKVMRADFWKAECARLTALLESL